MCIAGYSAMENFDNNKKSPAINRTFIILFLFSCEEQCTALSLFLIGIFPINFQLWSDTPVYYISVMSFSFFYDTLTAKICDKEISPIDQQDNDRSR